MRVQHLLLLALIATAATGCEAIASIFRAGFWVGIVLVLLLVGLVGFLASRARR